MRHQARDHGRLHGSIGQNFSNQIRHVNGKPLNGNGPIVGRHDTDPAHDNATAGCHLNSIVGLNGKSSGDIYSGGVEAEPAPAGQRKVGFADLDFSLCGPVDPSIRMKRNLMLEMAAQDAAAPFKSQ